MFNQLLLLSGGELPQAGVGGVSLDALVPQGEGSQSGAWGGVQLLEANVVGQTVVAFASGAATLDPLAVAEASGTISSGLGSGGSPLDDLTASGQAGYSGGVELLPIEASGTATIDPAVNGGVVLSSLLASGSAIASRVATGGVTLGTVSADGTAHTTPQCSGGVVLIPLDAHGEKITTTNVIAVNLANRAVTTYDSYNFDSFAVIGGVPMGATSSGLFRLDGDGVVDSSFTLGTITEDVGLRLEDVFVHGYVEQDMEVEVRHDDVEEVNTYPAVGDGSRRRLRAKFGKGVKGTEWTVTVRSVNGARFSVSALDITTTKLSRKRVA